ncbi:hypothetical protein AOLI_G00077210 [Acnodon oligacanthus]
MRCTCDNRSRRKSKDCISAHSEADGSLKQGVRGQFGLNLRAVYSTWRQQPAVALFLHNFIRALCGDAAGAGRDGASALKCRVTSHPDRPPMQPPGT